MKLFKRHLNPTRKIKIILTMLGELLTNDAPLGDVGLN
jgi:hypothetical protein